MKFAILSLVAAAGLTISAGTASAHPPGSIHGGYGGYSYHPYGGHLDYHNGHYHYHNGYYRSGPLVPAYPTYSYPSYGYGYGYNSGFGLTVTRPGFGLGVGSGYAVPYYGGNYYGRRW